MPKGTAAEGNWFPKIFVMPKPYIDPYSLLGLERTATEAEIKKAYFAQVRAYPPERDPARFKQIRAAYEALRDSEIRSATEQTLLKPWPGASFDLTPPEFDLTLHLEDILAVAQALSDLERKDWREHYGQVKL